MSSASARPARLSPVHCIDDLQDNDQLLFRCLPCRNSRTSLLIREWPADLRQRPLVELLNSGRLKCERCGCTPAAVEVLRIVHSTPMLVFRWPDALERAAPR